MAPSDPQIVYVGTGEPNNRQSSSWGNGVYKTLDGGKTWTAPRASRDTHHIGRVVVHPREPRHRLRRGARPPLGAEQGARALQDDGRRQDLDQHEVRRRGHRLRGRGHGPARARRHALRRVLPAAPHAVRLQRRRPRQRALEDDRRRRDLDEADEGPAPRATIGRIGIAVYRRDPRIVYALVEHAKEGGIFRSDDRGETWKKMSDTNPRPSYYSQVRIDPNNDQRIWVLGAPMFTLGGRRQDLPTDVVQKIHGDYHALWIDPADSDHMLVGTRRRHARHLRPRPHLGLRQHGARSPSSTRSRYDMQRPYRVCGGLQDNGSWCGPSRTLYQRASRTRTGSASAAATASTA